MIQNRFNAKEAEGLDDLGMRVYTSRLLGSDQDLVLHGGGNTSVKIDDILYVKGSGWDLGSIEKEGFSPAKLDALLSLLEYDTLSDSDMVRYQKEALTDKSAPNPSIEAILHALIPYKFVDHTHADAIVTISNTVNGKTLIESLYGENYLIVPYVMPGFVLAKVIDEMTRGVEWESLEGMILLNHGVFTFDNNARISYDKMIDTVARAEAYLEANAALDIEASQDEPPYDLEALHSLLSEAKGYDVTLRLNRTPLARFFVSQKDEELYHKGVLTPEHIIRTKRFPAVFDRDYKEELNHYIKNYEDYFARHATNEIMLNPAPNWAVIKDVGTLAIGKNDKEAKIIEDITLHTMKAILHGEKLGGYQSISEADSFAMEYWELEQMKLLPHRQT
jgi:rhamnose utilization protein RhaD (predicted bifunctional aldolase and dehydrogenase)